MPNVQLIQKLQEVKAQIPEIKSKGVEHRDSAEFYEWNEKSIKWLKLGGLHTSSELDQFKNLTFMNVSVRAFGEEGYNYDDQNEYMKHCERAVIILKSAIENLEENLVLGNTAESKTRPKTGGGEFLGVSIGQAGTVVMGDRNIVAKIDSITVFDFLKVLEKEIEERVQEPEQKATLLRKVKDISQNPAVNVVLSQSLGQILRSIFEN